MENPEYFKEISAEIKIIKANIKIIYFFRKLFFFSCLWISKKEAIIEIKGIYSGIPALRDKASITIFLLSDDGQFKYFLSIFLVYFG